MTTSPSDAFNNNPRVPDARVDPYLRYRIQITGWLPGEDGSVPSYRRLHPGTGEPVDFDGRVERGDDVVFLMAEYGMRDLVFDPEGEFAMLVRRELPAQVTRQLEVLKDNESLEIHVSDPYGASGVRTLLEFVGLGGRVAVVYTPPI